MGLTVCVTNNAKFRITLGSTLRKVITVVYTTNNQKGTLYIKNVSGKIKIPKLKSMIKNHKLAKVAWPKIQKIDSKGNLWSNPYLSLG